MGSDVFVRRSMFDECKSEKILELLAAFSTAVLRKKAAEEATGDHRKLESFLSATPMSAYDSMLPLAVAHKASLKKILKRKDILRSRFNGLVRILDQKEIDLDQNFDQIIKNQDFLDSNSSSDETTLLMAQTLETHWQGDKRYVNTVLQGNNTITKDSLLGISFDTLWPQVVNGEIRDENVEQGPGLLQDLENRIQTQKHRISHWKSFKETLNAQQQSRCRRKTAPHQSKHIIEKETIKFTSMEEERDIVFSPRKSPRKSGPLRTNVLRENFEFESDVLHLQTECESSPNKGDLPPREGLETGQHCVIPTRGAFDDESQNQESSDSGQAPRDVLDKHRYPNRSIALETYLHSPAGQQSQHKGKKEHDQDYNAIQSALQTPSFEFRAQKTKGLDQCLERGSMTEIGVVPDDFNLRLREDQYQESASVELFDLPKDRKSILKNLSLEERTRQSMSIATSARLFDVEESPDAKVTPRHLPHKLDGGPHAKRMIGPEGTGRLKSAIASEHNTPQHQDFASSERFSINRFQTPKRGGNSPALTESEMILDPSSDYDSVFRSRPKIANSPRVSPFPSP